MAMSSPFSKLIRPATVISERTSAQDAASASPENIAALLAEARPIALTGKRLLAVQAVWLLMRLDKELLEARAQWNQDWFRRVMHARSKAASRLRRRWARMTPPPATALGSLRRRYHANLAGHFYQPGL
jgi:hypothetical protein